MQSKHCILVNISHVIMSYQLFLTCFVKSASKFEVLIIAHRCQICSYIDFLHFRGSTFRFCHLFSRPSSDMPVIYIYSPSCSIIFSETQPTVNPAYHCYVYTWPCWKHYHSLKMQCLEGVLRSSLFQTTSNFNSILVFYITYMPLKLDIFYFSHTSKVSCIQTVVNIVNYKVVILFLQVCIHKTVCGLLARDMQEVWLVSCIWKVWKSCWMWYSEELCICGKCSFLSWETWVQTNCL